jgi:hypothetical protein
MGQLEWQKKKSIFYNLKKNASSLWLVDAHHDSHNLFSYEQKDKKEINRGTLNRFTDIDHLPYIFQGYIGRHKIKQINRTCWKKIN